MFRIEHVFFLDYRTIYLKASVISPFVFWTFGSVSLIFPLLYSLENLFKVFSSLISFFKKPSFSSSSSSAFSTSLKKWLSADLFCLRRSRSSRFASWSSLTKWILSSFSFVIKRRRCDLRQVFYKVFRGTWILGAILETFWRFNEYI
jgi:hypothetical protein